MNDKVLKRLGYTHCKLTSKSGWPVPVENPFVPEVIVGQIERVAFLLSNIFLIKAFFDHVERTVSHLLVTQHSILWEKSRPVKLAPCIFNICSERPPRFRNGLVQILLAVDPASLVAMTSFCRSSRLSQEIKIFDLIFWEEFTINFLEKG